MKTRTAEWARTGVAPLLRVCSCARAAGLVLALLAILCLAPRTPAQNSPYPYGGGHFPRPQMQDPMGPPAGGDFGNAQMQEKRLAAFNAERQKTMVSDTNKLVKLAAQLNSQINGTHPASLTEDQLRMVAEIEKLAHNIREKMTTPINGTQRPGPAPSVIMPSSLP